VSPADAVSRPAPLAPKIVSEVRELHERCAELARDGRGRKGRRDRREAREAETDLLRALGFANYEAFMAVVGARNADLDGIASDDFPLAEEQPDEPEREAPGLSLVEPPAPSALDAKETEAALIRVIRGEGRTPRPPRPTPNDDAQPSAELIADLHARVAAFEEELAETRFELRRVRDELRSRSDSPPIPESPDLSGAVREAAAGLAVAAGEMRSLCELLREERGELAALAATARANAEQLLQLARVDAQRVTDEAAAEARAVLDQARAEAVALTRNAISTVDGLRRLASEERAAPDDGSSFA
jgi:cell division septum initiation protein DivIVA